MVKNICLVLLFIFPFIHCHSQVLPKEGSELNYRIVPFSFPVSGGSFTLEIASGRYFSEDSFRKNIVLKMIDTGNKIIAEVPAFGSQYTWRITPNSGSKSGKRSSFYHFSTGIIPEVDTSMTRLRIIQPALEYKDAYVFCDGAKALYDMKGNPVWYLPLYKIANRENCVVRDIKITPQNTITFILQDLESPQIYEINFNGDVLWKGPNNGKVSGDTIEHYHNEFTRLRNGHYMVMGYELIGKLSRDNTITTINSNSKSNSEVGIHFPFKKQFGTIIEYDTNGKVVWNWKSSNYFPGSDICNYLDTTHRNPEPDIHDNSFFFDEKSNFIYISYKRISRVMKLKYPEGIVTNTYGEIYKPGIQANGNKYFCSQHSCKKSESGYLYLYNNNDCRRPEPPSIVMMQEPIAMGDSLKTVWEFSYSGSMNNEMTVKNGIMSPVTIGGNVQELPDKSIFVSDCLPFSYLYIVTKSKKIIWSALPEILNTTENKWNVSPQYRTSIIANRQDFEKLVLGKE